MVKWTEVSVVVLFYYFKEIILTQINAFHDPDLPLFRPA
jgi:hypothetical protein